MEPNPAKPKIYVESSTISYLTARPSLNIVVNARQELTRQWWERQGRYELFVSNAVIEEVMEGDPEAAEARLKKCRFALDRSGRTPDRRPVERRRGS